jgi:adenosine kinase
MDKKGLLGLTKTIITTLGEKGSLVSTRVSDHRIPPAGANKVVDPTGAGDAYRAGLIKGLVMGKDIVTAARMGSVAAAYAIEAYGTQEHRYSFEAFVERYKDNFGEI